MVDLAGPVSDSMTMHKEMVGILLLWYFYVLKKYGMLSETNLLWCFCSSVCVFVRNLHVQGRIQKFSMGGAQTLIKKESGGAWVPTHNQTPYLSQNKGRVQRAPLKSIPDVDVEYRRLAKSFKVFKRIF